jgi:hypothetical protein
LRHELSFWSHESSFSAMSWHGQILSLVEHGRIYQKEMHIFMTVPVTGYRHISGQDNRDDEFILF